jgi:addiction module HigA family antidote
MARLHAPIHPGEILAEEFLAPLGVTQYRLAKDTSVPARRINEIVKGDRSISADTALRFAKYFGTSELFWLNLQARYDLEIQKDRLGKRLDTEVLALQRPPVSSRSGRSSATQPRKERTRHGNTVSSGFVRKAK